jgi:hypothetical protein
MPGTLGILLLAVIGSMLIHGILTANMMKILATFRIGRGQTHKQENIP